METETLIYATAIALIFWLIAIGLEVLRIREKVNSIADMLEQHIERTKPKIINCTPRLDLDKPADFKDLEIERLKNLVEFKNKEIELYREYLKTPPN